MTLNQPWSNIGTAHRFIILDICAKLFVNPTRGSKDIEWTRKRDRQTDRQTDGQTDNGAKNNMSPHFIGGDIIISAPDQETVEYSPRGTDRRTSRLLAPGPALGSLGTSTRHTH